MRIFYVCVAPIDIQTILNGEAKFCKHCDVVIITNMIRKKVAELPFICKDSEVIADGDELFFCSTTCYMQYALMHRSPSLSEDKVSVIIHIIKLLKFNGTLVFVFKTFIDTKKLFKKIDGL